ncbi:MAG: transglutaminase family protein [Eggerthellaceae bacterium]|nr:transglutaminase family protein [Eggerthellaceae bacterium]
MKRLRYTFSTEIQFSDPVVEHTFVLRCQPHRRPGIRVLEDELTVEPDMRYMRQIDGFGNKLAIGREPLPHTRMAYHSSGLVEIDHQRSLAPGAIAAGTAGEATPGSWTAAHPIYRYPSELTRPNDALLAFAHDVGYPLLHVAKALSGMDVSPSKDCLVSPSAQQGNGVLGIKSSASAVEAEVNREEAFTSAVEALSHAVFEYMDYAPGTTHVRTTAAEAFAARAGVCQDFSHVLICILRELGIPARYVSGLALGEGQTHAWIEAFFGDGWKGFDPTRDTLVDETYIPLAVGRDWTDCPIEQGSFIGFASQTQFVHMTVTEA